VAAGVLGGHVVSVGRAVMLRRLTGERRGCRQLSRSELSTAAWGARCTVLSQRFARGAELTLVSAAVVAVVAVVAAAVVVVVVVAVAGATRRKAMKSTCDCRRTPRDSNWEAWGTWGR